MHSPTITSPSIILYHLQDQVFPNGFPKVLIRYVLLVLLLLPTYHLLTFPLLFRLKKPTVLLMLVVVFPQAALLLLMLIWLVCFTVLFGAPDLPSSNISPCCLYCYKRMLGYRCSSTTLLRFIPHKACAHVEWIIHDNKPKTSSSLPLLLSLVLVLFSLGCLSMFGRPTKKYRVSSDMNSHVIAPPI